jgi:hypothetical protein
MPAHKYTMLQICIICCVLSMLGPEIVWNYPEFFNGAGRNKLHNATTQSADRFITLGSATSTEDSGFFDHVLPIFQAATGLDVHVEVLWQ